MDQGKKITIQTCLTCEIQLLAHYEARQSLKDGIFRNYYYDYVVEKPGRTVLAYDTITNKWSTVEGLQTPLALEGACTVRFGSMVVLIGGKDEDGVIHKDVWALDIGHLEAGWSNQLFPSMNHPRYHQGCSVVSLGTKTVIAVAGGIGECRNTSSTVESITLANSDKNEEEGKFFGHEVAAIL